MSPLYAAAQCGHVAATAALLAHPGVNPNEGELGVTPLYIGMQHGRTC